MPLDFRSALYLGLRHAHADLRSWTRLTTGAPAALIAPPDARRVEGGLARLQGTESAVLAPSTLHVFLDLFHLLAKEDVIIMLDSGAYPVARWGIECAQLRGVPVRRFQHFDAESLEFGLRAGRRRASIIVSDGLCPECGSRAPLQAYLNVARRYGGALVVDDTQALGIYGRGVDRRRPWGSGGGGSLRAGQISGPDVILVSSLAKGFGAPVAALSGPRALVRAFAANSRTREHSSPPSSAVVHAASRALHFNAHKGDSTRARLLLNVRCFRSALARVDVPVLGRLFPVQTLADVRGPGAIALHDRLQTRGIRTVLRRGPRGSTRLSFVLRADHTPGDLSRTTEALVQELRQEPRLRTHLHRPAGECHHVEDP